MTAPRTIDALLVEHQEALARFVRNKAGARLLRFETVEDLVQGVHIEALKAAGQFEYRSEPEYLAWIYRIARHHIYNRAAYWNALKRNSGGLIRLIDSETEGGFEPADTGTSPSSFAGRREQIVLIARALASMRERDQTLLRAWACGVSIEEAAAQLELSYDAAKRARLRAIERLKKLHRLMSG